MAQAATAPLPLTPVNGAHAAREQERDARPSNSHRSASIEERTTALEIRWEVTIPTLATKTDVINLENRLLRWGVGAAIGLAAVLTALFTHSATRMDNALAANTAHMDSTLAAHTTRIDNALAANTARMDNAIAELKAESQAMNARIDRLDSRMDRLDARIDRLDEKIDARFDALMAEIRALGRAQ